MRIAVLDAPPPATGTAEPGGGAQDAVEAAPLATAGLRSEPSLSALRRLGARDTGRSRGAPVLLAAGRRRGGCRARAPDLRRRRPHRGGARTGGGPGGGAGDGDGARPARRGALGPRERLAPGSRPRGDRRARGQPGRRLLRRHGLPAAPGERRRRGAVRGPGAPAGPGWQGRARLSLGDGGDVEQGETVLAFGFPAGSSPGEDASSTRGVVSAASTFFKIRRPDVPFYPEAIRTDTALDPGFSGGPLVDLEAGRRSASTRGAGDRRSTGDRCRARTTRSRSDRARRVLDRPPPRALARVDRRELRLPDAGGAAAEHLPEGLFLLGAVAGRPPPGGARRQGRAAHGRRRARRRADAVAFRCAATRRDRAADSARGSRCATRTGG